METGLKSSLLAILDFGSSMRLGITDMAFGRVLLAGLCSEQSQPAQWITLPLPGACEQTFGAYDEGTLDLADGASLYADCILDVGLYCDGNLDGGILDDAGA